MAEALTSMALSAKEAKAQLQPMAASNAPRYPWGLGIELDTRSLAKLKIAELPKVGSYVTVTAYCCVKGVNLNEEADGDENRSVRLQIERMAVTPVKGKGSARKRVAAGEERTESAAERRAERAHPAAERAEGTHTAKKRVK